MPDTARRKWQFYIDSMIGIAENINAYTDGLGTTGRSA